MDNTLDIELLTLKMTFKGDQADPNVAITDTMMLRNNNGFPVIVVFYPIPETDEYTMTWACNMLTIAAGEKMGVELAVTLKFNTVINRELKFAVHKKEKPSQNIDIRELTKGKELGLGSFGTVFTGKWHGQGCCHQVHEPQV